MGRWCIGDWNDGRLFDVVAQSDTYADKKARQCQTTAGLNGLSFVILEVGAAPEDRELLAVDEHGGVGIGAEVCRQLVFLGT